jgi:hypothetical protein
VFTSMNVDFLVADDSEKAFVEDELVETSDENNETNVRNQSTSNTRLSKPSYTQKECYVEMRDMNQ